MVDDDPGDEPEWDHEETGSGQGLGAETDESDSVLADQTTRPCGQSVSQPYHPINRQASVVRDIDGGQEENSDDATGRRRIIEDTSRQDCFANRWIGASVFCGVQMELIQPEIVVLSNIHNNISIIYQLSVNHRLCSTLLYGCK